MNVDATLGPAKAAELFYVFDKSGVLHTEDNQPVRQACGSGAYARRAALGSTRLRSRSPSTDGLTLPLLCDEKVQPQHERYILWEIDPGIGIERSIEDAIASKRHQK